MIKFYLLSEKIPLVCDKTILDLFRIDDISNEYISWLNDKEVTKYSNQRFKTHDFDSCKQYLDSFEHTNNIFLSIKEKKTGVMVGTLTIYYNDHHQVADIGIMIGNKNYWGKGLAKDAWENVLKLLLNDAEVRKVTGGTLSCNKSMINIMQKAGMLPDGVRKSQELVGGESFDIVYFCAFRY